MKRTLNYIALAALGAAMFSSCSKQNVNTGTTTDTMATANQSASQANITLTRGFYEDVMNKHDTAACAKYCSDNFVDHNPAPGHSGQGIGDLKADLASFFATFPDLHFDIQDISGSGNIVWLRYTMTGAMKGNMGPMKGTNKSMKVGGIDEITIDNGKATDRWGYSDDMAMMQQLGMMPAPGGKK